MYLEEEFLIRSGKGGVESVMLGKMEGKQLRYVACLDVRMPTTESVNATKKLNALKIDHCPFPEIPERKPGNSWSGGIIEQEPNTSVWVKPYHTIEVNFLEWTRGGIAGEDI